MMSFIQKYKWFLSAAVFAIAALVIAFLSGGSVEQAAKQARQRQAAAVVTSDSAQAASAPTSGNSAYQPDMSEASNGTTAATQPPSGNTTAKASSASGTTAAQPTTSVPPSQAAANTPSPTQATPPPGTALQTATTAPPPTQGAAKPTDSVKPTCTISVSCATILDNMDKLDPDLSELVPSDGWLLKPIKVTLRHNETVFDVLKRVCKQKNIHMEFSDSPVYHSAYIEGIGNLYEFDCGANSGWMFCVNGSFPSVGCSQVTVSSGDTIEWRYTCNFGYDVGGGAR